MKTKLFFAVLAITAFTAVANAQDTKKSEPQKANGSAYVDKNGNGTCDNFENGTSNRAKHKGQGIGQGRKGGKCDGAGRHMRNGKGKGKGANYTDKDGNGVCDNLNTRQK